MKKVVQVVSQDVYTFYLKLILNTTVRYQSMSHLCSACNVVILAYAHSGHEPQPFACVCPKLFKQFELCPLSLV